MLTKSVRISVAPWVNLILPIGPSEECGRTYVTLMLTHLIYEAPLSHPLFSFLLTVCPMPWKYLYKMEVKHCCTLQDDNHICRKDGSGCKQVLYNYIILYSLCMLGRVFKRAVVLTVSLLSILENTEWLQNCLLLCQCIGTI